ncbi:hypothetical protein TTHERM_00420100 (macronuclear) [Tetrahymena thermophila SB210]|uniref:Uncharacterized protein n=1 Tax=Tetrahymena thermophila (strain SB210) TaxID=312017 RepID=I7M6P8_TETTS|nr:hypothetical protein TTHERM_00420100 [Tetrahymena thermophila SB210]EAR85602.1 hypothetical protein TTHERM_00420100 [Tetrahymena thermophila SB210]|eukprot:XP_001033265.1 hypothetical protein TTHERM_00420100 [Tetrahymena thermophila SB210]
MESGQQTKQEIINHELFKTATFFDPDVQKESVQQNQHDVSSKKSLHQRHPANPQISSANIFKSYDQSVNSALLQNSLQGNSTMTNKNPLISIQDNVNEELQHDQQPVVPQMQSFQQSMHSSSNRKRPLLAFKLSPSSTRSYQQSTNLEDKQLDTEFDFIQSVQDAEFWNKVNMIISEKDENKGKSQGRLISLPSIHQKGSEYTRKQEKTISKSSINNQYLQGWEMSSSCSTRDSLRQNQQQLNPPLSQQNQQIQNKQLNQRQPLQKPILQFSQSSVALKMSPQASSFGGHLNSVDYQKSLLSTPSVNLKNLISSPQNQQNQHSFQLESLRTEESSHILSPESNAYPSPIMDSFNPSSNYSDQLSTNPNTNSTVSQSHSMFNSQFSQNSAGQPYIQNNLLMRQKSPQSEKFTFSAHVFQNAKQQKPENQQIGTTISNSQYTYAQIQSERIPTREDVSYPSIISKNNQAIPPPLKLGNLQQQRIKRDNHMSLNQSNQNDFQILASSKRSQAMQSYKSQQVFKNEEKSNQLNQDIKRKNEFKQNILLKDNNMSSVSTFFKRNIQLEQLTSPRQRTDSNTLQNQNYDIFDNYQFLKCNEDISHPLYLNNDNYTPNSKQLQTDQFNQVPFGKINKLAQSNNKAEDPLRRSLFNNGQQLKNDFSFCEDGSNNLLKISQSAQGYREQAKKINLRSKQQENLVKKLFKIEEKSQNLTKNNYLNNSNQQKQQQGQQDQSHQ